MQSRLALDRTVHAINEHTGMGMSTSKLPLGAKIVILAHKSSRRR